MILTIRTDRPEAELSLYNGKERVAGVTWQGHRQLAETLHVQMQKLLEGQGKTLEDLTGVVVYRGPGSFTGLRIGVSVANALAYGLSIPVVGTMGESWQRTGLKTVQNAPLQAWIVPEYGALPNITQQKK